MKAALLVIMLLFLVSCSKGPHVDIYQRTMVQYACYYSDSIWKADRRVAICPTEQECNEICSKLPREP